MKEHVSTSREIQKMVADVLRADEWFKAHRVAIVEQDSEELAFMLRRKVEAIDGPVMVVGTDALSNDYPAVEATVFVSATEHVPTNRALQGFTTAIAAVEAAIDDIDGENWHWAEDLRHETPKEGSGILVARTSFRGCVERTAIPAEEDGRYAPDAGGAPSAVDGAG